MPLLIEVDEEAVLTSSLMMPTYRPFVAATQSALTCHDDCPLFVLLPPIMNASRRWSIQSLSPPNKGLVCYITPPNRRTFQHIELRCAYRRTCLHEQPRHHNCLLLVVVVLVDLISHLAHLVHTTMLHLIVDYYVSVLRAHLTSIE